MKTKSISRGVFLRGTLAAVVLWGLEVHRETSVLYAGQTNTTGSAAGRTAIAEAARTNAPPLTDSPLIQIDADWHGRATGRIVAVEQNTNAVRLRFGFSDPPLTVLAVGARTNLFSSLAGLKGKIITVSGEFEAIPGNHGQLQITLHNSDQLKVLQEPGAGLAEGTK